MKGCSLIQMCALTFNGRIDTGDPVISLCCEGIPDIPKIAFSKTPKETLRCFMGEYALVAAESRFLSNDSQRCYTAGCAQCSNYREGGGVGDGRIHYVNLSMYPAPCQSRCIYCGVHKESQIAFSAAAKAAYEQLFDVLALAGSCGVLAEDAVWQISSGEITIHPYRERIMSLVSNRRAIFYTNCMKFDEGIARNLHDDPGSAIDLSIDAGTAETWYRVKGVDNFDTVTSNLVRYYTESARPGQIALKYIVLPGINDIYEDYVSLMEIMKVLQVQHLTISRDTNKKYHATKEERITLLSAAAYLLALCHKNSFTVDMFTYTPSERTEIVKLAGEIIKKQLI